MPTFMSLPTEIRYLIYDELYDRGLDSIIFKVYFTFDENDYSLALTCRTIHQEVQPFINRSRPFLLVVGDEQQEEYAMGLNITKVSPGRKLHPLFKSPIPSPLDATCAARMADVVVWSYESFGRLPWMVPDGINPRVAIIHVDYEDWCRSAFYLRDQVNIDQTMRYDIGSLVSYFIATLSTLLEVHVVIVSQLLAVRHPSFLLPKPIWEYGPTIKENLAKFEGSWQEERHEDGLLTELKLTGLDGRVSRTVKITHSTYTLD